MKKTLLPLLIACCLPQPCLAAEPPPAELLAEAREQQLHLRPHWLRLGHYHESWTGGWESEIDGSDFFIAADGKHDPRAELEATIRAWFRDDVDPETEQPLQCRFPARYAWLDERLELSTYRSAPDCPEFRDWLDAINPGSLTLIFPSSYLNNPASMYGHTLLRIDPPAGQAELASYAVNFAARTEERNGFVFAVKGLTGMYDGYFALLPYYRKVNEYNDIENRDIWEYPLDFTQQEIHRLLMHLWEVGPASLEYYFFDENCSYQLLTLLEVARPGLRLTDDYTYQVIPADTVRQVLADAGLKDEAAFRASLATRLSHQAGHMDSMQLSLARRLSRGEVSLAEADIDALPARSAAQVLDMAYLLIQYRHFREGGEQSASSALALPILQRRAKLDVNASFSAIKPPDSAPHRGHGTTRISLGTGRSGNDGVGLDYSAVALRAAYHDLLDPWPGFLEGAAITMFGAEGRHYEDGTTRLQRFDLVEVESLSPRGRLFSPLSWRVSAGWRRDEPFGAIAPLAFTLQGGPGMTWEAAGGLLSVQLGAEFRYHDDIPGNQSWAVEPRALYAASPSPRWTIQLQAGRRHYTSGLDGRRDHLSIGQQFMLGKDIGLRFTLTRERQADRYASQADLRLMIYY